MKDFLIKGRKNEKTKEKLRIKIRFLLNKHKAASLFVSNFSNSKLEFELERDGFKAAFSMYKSKAISSCAYFCNAFNDLYVNELVALENDTYFDKSHEKSNYQIILAFRKTKKLF